MKKLFTLILLTLCCFSCSLPFFEREKSVYKESTAEPRWTPKKAERRSEESLAVSGTVKIKQPEPPEKTAPKKEDKAEGEIEITWLIPEDEVDGFILDYGYDKENLVYQKKIAADSLEKIEHEQHGLIYRYVLQEVPENSEVYVRISAYAGDEVSDPSPLMHIK